MVKHTQTIRRRNPTNCLSMFDHFLGLAVKGLKKGIAYSQALCVKRISSINSEFEAYINKIQDQVV